MKKKIILIGAGVLAALFLLILIIVGGSAGTKNVPKQETLEVNFSGVVCEVSGEENTTYDITTLTNNIQFDSTLKLKNYNKIKIQNTKNLKSLGVAFIMQSTSKTEFTFTLKKNNETLKTYSVEVEANETKNVDLVLENSVEILTTDEFYIEVNGSANFVFDTILFFVDEV